MRQWLYAWLLDPKIAGNYHQSLDRWIALLIVGNLLALMFEHVPALYLPYQSWFHLFDVASVAVFSAEYLLRLYLAPEDPEFKNRGSPRLRFMRSPFGIIDLLAIAPFTCKPSFRWTCARCGFCACCGFSNCFACSSPPGRSSNA